MLSNFDNELLIGQLIYKQKAEIFNANNAQLREQMPL